MVSRPAHVSAIRERGLTLQTAKDVDRVDVDVVASIDELVPGDDDVVVITAKTQDAPPIHAALFD